MHGGTGKRKAAFFIFTFFCVCLLSLPRISGAEQTSEGFSVKMLYRGPDTQTLRMRFVGSDPTPEVIRLVEKTGPFNTGFGGRPSGDPVRWRSGSTSVRRIVYRNLYPGIDLVSYGRDGSIRYDLVVSPGADLSRVRIRYEGLENHRLGGTFPGYQVLCGVQVEVPIYISEADDSAYRLAAGRRDPEADLVIPTTCVPLQFTPRSLASTK